MQGCTAVRIYIFHSCLLFIPLGGNVNIWVHRWEEAGEKMKLLFMIYGKERRAGL